MSLSQKDPVYWRWYHLAMLAFSSLLVFLSFPALVRAQAKAQRPPQYILISFDGSYTNDMWKATREHAVASNARVTHFISGVDFLIGSSSRKIEGSTDHIYIPPQYSGKGSRSSIGFGGDKNMMTRRVREIKASMDAGMEIGGHGNSHFDGTRWSLQDWTYEFTLFFKYVYQVFSINRLSESAVQVTESDWKNTLTGQLRSFRAPFLGRGRGLWETLGQKVWDIDDQRVPFTFAYDASDIARSPSAWPTKSDLGFWYFRMAVIPVPGMSRGILSMDYNFYASHADNPNSPKDKPEKAEYFEEQMYNAYVQWFLKNYHGNRAPINIGHHFSTWNKGAYWKALKRFMTTVCSLPEVECATGLELAEYLDNTPTSVLEDYAKGQFDRRGMPTVEIPVSMPVSMFSDRKSYPYMKQGTAYKPETAVDKVTGVQTRYYWQVEGQTIVDDNLNLLDLARRGASRIDLIAVDDKGTDKLPLMLDWNPASGQTELFYWREESIRSCTGDAHDEKVDAQHLLEGRQI